MNQITIVDARMGRGKSSAAIRHINENRGKKRFLYITPFLDEVDRVCTQCDLEQSEGDTSSKSYELKLLLHRGENIAATHSLFYLMDNETINLIRERKYSLIIDESIRVVEKLSISDKDFDLILDHLADVGDDGYVTWRDPEYAGRLSVYKRIADTHSLYKLDHAFINLLNPDLLRAFREVHMLTYLFDGQYQKAYLDYFGFDYRVVGIETDDKGYKFSEHPDNPPPTNYRDLIHIVRIGKDNYIGKNRYDLSKTWFNGRGYDHPDMKALRANMRTFFRMQPHGSNSTRLWTCFKSAQYKLVDIKTGRFKNNFLQIRARATNAYREKTDLAYMANLFVDPNISKFFASKGISINSDKYALSEMVQWIWRSAIRDNKPISIFVPSKRMRTLLSRWVDESSRISTPCAEGGSDKGGEN